MEIEKSLAIWNTLYNLHWDYIQTEENSTELLLKKDKLKACIQEFLSTTPPDRKFYLPQTVDVLRGSVQNLIHFAAYEASIAFDAIAQYANNLLTKPWRSEYKVIKTHSGFYQHKIKSQLVDVDELFIAMGYVKSQNQTLVFDGPICQDQLANVSRDCMIACEECLIMHRLYYALQDDKEDVTWAEVYRFRELYHGDEQSLISVQQKKPKDRTLVPEHFINQINQIPVQRCNCNVVNTMNNPQYQPCQYNYQPIGNNECINHHLPISHYNCYQPHYDHVSHLPHSRSMDQYTDHIPISHGLFRHSLDHSITNDTVDGHQRYGKQFVPHNHTVYPQTETASNFYNNHLNHYEGNEYASIAASNRPTNANFPSNKILPRSYDQPINYDDHSSINYYTPNRNCDEDLIKFEDNQKMNVKTDRNYGHSDLSYEYNNAQYIDQLRKADSQLNRPMQSSSYANALKQSQNLDSKPISLLEQKLRELDIGNGGLMKTPNELREFDKSLDRKELRTNEQRRIKNNQILAKYEVDDQHSRDSRASDFDSTDYAYDEDNAKASRNKDGQGSMEEWSYVYNGIKKNSQINGHTLSNGHDKTSESKQKSVVKKSKEPKGEVSVMKSVMKDSNKTKANKLRPTNLNIDEHDLYKNSIKKQQKNGRPTNKSPVTVNEWDCEHCTFINTGSTNICSMCSKSKNFKDAPSSKSAPTAV